jgi:hypothetical protein
MLCSREKARKKLSQESFVDFVSDGVEGFLRTEIVEGSTKLLLCFHLLNTLNVPMPSSSDALRVANLFVFLSSAREKK